jgi:hypothetical protein
VKDFGARSTLIVLLLTLTTLLGCSSLNANPAVQQAQNGTSGASNGATVSSKIINFGNVPLGKTQTHSVTVTNPGIGTLTITRAAISGAGFALIGPTLPVVLPPKRTTAIEVSFTPTAGGTKTGTVSLMGTTRVRFGRRSDGRRGQEIPVDVSVTTISTTLTIAVSGVGMVSGQLAVSPATLALGRVKIGGSQTQSATLVNSGTGTVTLKQAVVSGHGFKVSGISFPTKLSPGQQKTFSVTFTPQSTGTSTGSVAVTSDAPNSVVSVPVSGVAVGFGTLVSNPASLDLGSVEVGQPESVSATLTNTGTANVNISQANVSGTGFTVGGLSLPATLSPGQSAAVTVTFSPKSAGAASGALSVASDASNSVLAIPLAATAVTAGSLTSAPSSLNFGSVQVGTPKSISAKLTNAGGADITLSQASVSGTGFTLSGVSLPAILAAGQSKTLSVTFNPQSAGSASGTLSLVSNAANSSLAVPLTATGASPAVSTLAASPSSLTFSNVQVGTPKTVSETLTNSGNATVAISRATASGAGFAISGLSLPATVAAGQSTTFSVTFTPQSSGSATGSLAIVSDASNASLTIPLSANVAGAAALSASDSSLDFSTVPVNSTNTLSETLTNTGGTSVTVTQANVSGTGFKVTGLTLPLTLAAGQSFTFGTVFAPTSGGSATGSISVISDAANSTLTISMVGTATVAGQLAVSPSTLNFGSVVVGQSKSMSASLSATGSSITITGANMSTSEFTMSGLSFPVTLAAGKTVSFTVKFTPQSSGTAAASASFGSNASNSSTVQSLTGSGTPAPQHNVALSWSPSSSSSVLGYNVYRGANTGGPYSQITSMNADTTFTDSSVLAGQTYFYVTTAVDGTGKESTYSNQTQAVIPTP